MFFSIISFILFSSLFIFNESCKCAPRKPSIIFCNNDWTSYVKIIGKYKVENYEDNSSNVLMFGTNILYHTENNEVFKKPENLTTLPNVIFTPQSGATCGIMGLEVGKEYLLSGSYNKGILQINSCNQMYAEGSSDYGATPQEWSNVPTIQKTMLKNGSYNNCTNVE
ncbi:Netrin domain and Proteinase inhibitor I35, tissue inhibitor of metalloproteinase family and Tissue inhibitor of metalloproteinases-like, OB-fold domain-containing protein [Strongyloides ratti]|uniref:Netrin domain and Proteinase inhibitor I35, tissue inhibitor of metalloproteinase family and Tissue inhibitor of metalloproteinases-like, OB-fold domain-containing protein n=1 Tax=Strongyloides ratti TaxID=34506 RepID=A0A090MV10_STRRB|nr:Netrin domain and Proteinase inhibitor I35, tissue inhibitor of metalloproteinase family and Tissue inhibitor of metalloproteinases-like, OB-fold domain-containing protein [Strongyloides ratti]CEF62573.1 Netrin domain and Proteinase inhibitor I35, tissue inhibitor of metalloproteinase family and Tissue inhibitor of metalloproteinases-like, OB-fold domain-containing protein [Strongyloides ratti]